MLSAAVLLSIAVVIYFIIILAATGEICDLSLVEVITFSLVLGIFIFCFVYCH